MGQQRAAADRQNRASAEASLYSQCQTLSALCLDDKALHLHPFLDGRFDATRGAFVPLQPPERFDNDDDEARLELLCAAHTDLFESMLQTADDLTPADRKSWYDYIEATYSRSPTLVRFIQRRPKDYTQRLLDFATKGVRPDRL